MIGPATSYVERIVTPLAGIEYPWSYICVDRFDENFICGAGVTEVKKDVNTSRTNGKPLRDDILRNRREWGNIMHQS